MEGRASLRVFGSGPEVVSRFGKCRFHIYIRGVIFDHAFVCKHACSSFSQLDRT